MWTESRSDIGNQAATFCNALARAGFLPRNMASFEKRGSRFFLEDNGGAVALLWKPRPGQYRVLCATRGAPASTAAWIASGRLGIHRASLYFADGEYDDVKTELNWK